MDARTILEEVYVEYLACSVGAVTATAAEGDRALQNERTAINAVETGCGLDLPHSE